MIGRARAKARTLRHKDLLRRLLAPPRVQGQLSILMFWQDSTHRLRLRNAQPRG